MQTRLTDQVGYIIVIARIARYLALAIYKQTNLGLHDLLSPIPGPVL